MVYDLRNLPDILGVLDRPPPQIDPVVALRKWAASGAMWLTGTADGPPRTAPVGVVSGVELLAELIGALGGPDLDGIALLGERAAAAAMFRQGDTSVGGNAHLVEAADGLVCLNLARSEDLNCLPALVSSTIDAGDWLEVQRAVSRRNRADLTEVADLLGMPIGVPGTAPKRPVEVVWGERRQQDCGVPLVVEFGSLWAAPLCGNLLLQSGCRVVKVESGRRQDGARRGPRAFFEILNGGKELIIIDPTCQADLAKVRYLVQQADVVIEASRPRALRQWGFDADREVASGKVWVSITGYGRTGPRSNGVAFGDDAAVSGGLLLDGPPGFVADAVADPVTGLLAAMLVLSALDDDTGVLLDLSLGGTALWLSSGDGVMAGLDQKIQVALPRLRSLSARDQVS